MQGRTCRKPRTKLYTSCQKINWNWVEKVHLPCTFCSSIKQQSHKSNKSIPMSSWWRFSILIMFKERESAGTSGAKLIFLLRRCWMNAARRVPPLFKCIRGLWPTVCGVGGLPLRGGGERDFFSEVLSIRIRWHRWLKLSLAFKSLRSFAGWRTRSRRLAQVLAHLKDVVLGVT